MSIEEADLTKHREPLWRELLLWRLWPLAWRGPVWFWVEEHTR